MSGLNNENSEARFGDMQELLVRIDKLLISLRTPIFFW